MSGPALTADRPEVPGFFGKLPEFPDFVGRRLPRSFLDPWDNWLQQGILSSRERLGVSWLGRLPGDIVIQRDGFTFYLPIATSILVSVVLSLILYLLRR